MTQDSDPAHYDLETREEVDSEISELAAQLDLSTDEATTAWKAVLAELEARDEASASAVQAGTEVMAAERFDAGALIDLLGSGKQPDLTEIAKDEIVKAVAKKLGIDPEKAGPMVDMILKMLDKPTTKPRRKKPAKKSTAKRPTTSAGSARRKKPASSSKAKKRPKAKPSATSSASSSAKPAAKKKRPAAKPAAAADAKPAARKKRPAAKPATSSTAKPAAKKRPTAKPRRRSTTRGDAEIAGAEQ